MSSNNKQVVWNNSIYIPTIYRSISKEDLWAYLEKNFGKVSRIDFVDLNENCRRAFVHFSEWFMDKYIAKIARQKIEMFGMYEFIMPIPNKHRKWFKGKLLINKNPLSENQNKTELQCSLERLCRLENIVEVLEKKMTSLENDKFSYEYKDKDPMHISELDNDVYDDRDKYFGWN